MLGFFPAGPKLTGHMEISLTTLPWFRNVRVTAFDSNEKVCWAAVYNRPQNGISALTTSKVLWAQQEALQLHQ